VNVEYRCRCGWVGESGRAAFLHRSTDPDHNQHNPTPVIKRVASGIEKEFSATIIEIPKRLANA